MKSVLIWSELRLHGVCMAPQTTVTMGIYTARPLVSQSRGGFTVGATNRDPGSGGGPGRGSGRGGDFPVVSRTRDGGGLGWTGVEKCANCADSPMATDPGSEAHGGFAHADRTAYWHSLASGLVGAGAEGTLDALRGLDAGSRVALVPFGGPMPSGGSFAAAFLLERICCAPCIQNPPLRIQVIPDSAPVRNGYVSLRLRIEEVESLLNAWRLRSAANKCGGDLLPVEKALIARRRKRNKELLSDTPQTLHLFFPAFRLSSHGEVKSVASRDHLGSSDAVNPAVLFTGDLEAVDEAGPPMPEATDIIIDCRARRVEAGSSDVSSLATLHPNARIHWLLPDLGHPLFNLLHGRGARVCWVPLLGSDESHSNRRRFALQSLPEASDDENEDLARLLQLLNDARRAAISAKHADGWRAYGLLRSAIKVLTTLPVPPTDYDAAAVEHLRAFTTQDFLEELNRRELLIAPSFPAIAAPIEEGRVILQAMVARLNEANRRAKAIVTSVETSFAKNQGLCVVVRRRATRMAVETFLSRELNTTFGDLAAAGIQVEVQADLVKVVHRRWPRLLWSNYADPSDLETILGHQRFGVTMLTGALERQLLRIDLEKWLRKATVAQEGSRAMGQRHGQIDEALEGLRSLLGELTAVAPFRTRTGPALNLEDLFEPIEIQAEPTTSRPLTNENRGTLRTAFRARFQEHDTVSYLPEGSLLTVFRGAKSDPIEMTVRELRPGDRVVFVNKTIGRSLYEVMQEQLEQSPTVGSASAYVGLWRRALQEGYRRRGLSFHDILRQIRARGSDITSDQTIRGWIRGAVIGPRDMENVDRMAAVLGIGQKDNRLLQEVREAMESTRTVNMRFSRIVYRAILAVGTGVGLSENDEALLDEHGLQLDDLKEAVSTLTVAEVATESESVPVGDLGVQTQA